MMTTGKFYGVHEEQYASKLGPATIKSNGKTVTWQFDFGGVVYSGAEPVDAAGEQAALYRARRGIDALATALNE